MFYWNAISFIYNYEISNGEYTSERLDMTFKAKYIETGTNGPGVRVILHDNFILSLKTY